MIETDVAIVINAGSFALGFAVASLVFALKVVHAAHGPRFSLLRPFRSRTKTAWLQACWDAERQGGA